MRESDVEVKSNCGDLVLIVAARNRDADNVKALIAAGMDVKAKNHDGDTALMLAARNHDSESVKALIAADADSIATLIAARDDENERAKYGNLTRYIFNQPHGPATVNIYLWSTDYDLELMLRRKGILGMRHSISTSGDHTTMKPVPDRKQLRREYLQKKRKAYTKMIFKIVFLPVLFAPGVYLYAQDYNSIVFITLAYCAIMLAVMVFSPSLKRLTCSGFIQSIRKDLTTAKNIPYVQPASPDIFPANEILLRPSQESESSKTLLRAAGKGEETPADELLRASQLKSSSHTDIS